MLSPKTGTNDEIVVIFNHEEHEGHEEKKRKKLFKERKFKLSLLHLFVFFVSFVVINKALSLRPLFVKTNPPYLGEC